LVEFRNSNYFLGL